MKWTTFLPLVLSVGTLLSFEHALYTASQVTGLSQQHVLDAVWQACFAYAESHDGNYPDGNSSNQALRQLFIEGLIADESVFALRGIYKVILDGNTGTAENGYLQALAPGECQLNYVRGLTNDKIDSKVPYIFTQTVGSDGDIRLIVVRESGKSDIYRTTNGTVLQEHNGQQVDIFSEAYLKEKYGILPQDILKPEGPLRDITALAHQRKMEIRLIESALLAAIWLPFLLIYWIKSRSKAPAMPLLKPQA